MAHLKAFSAPFVAAGLPGWSRFRTDLAARWQRHDTYRRTVRELAALSDRDLADLGFFRCDIRDIARAATHRR